MLSGHENPFSVTTPEGLSAEYIVETFTSDTPGLSNLTKIGHSMIFGVRGSGKSILLRYVEPDCQCRKHNVGLLNLGFFALYTSFRETEVRVTELLRLEHGSEFFNEHLLVVSVIARTCARILRNWPLPDTIIDDTAQRRVEGLLGTINATFRKDEPSRFDGPYTVKAALELIFCCASASYKSTIRYVRQFSFPGPVPPFDGYLLGFEDGILSYIDALRKCLGLSDRVPIFLMLDDADHLSEVQTRILNSWISRRLAFECSIKAAAQLAAYKTMLTTYSSRIEAPHDFHLINLSDYGSGREAERQFRVRMAQIVQQRLATVGIQLAAEKYFPEDRSQEIKIRRVAERLRAVWSKNRFMPGQRDALRSARTQYLATLGTDRADRTGYSYSGFEQICYISSQIPRFFLEAAANMYDQSAAAAPRGRKLVEEIDPDTQNRVIRSRAERQFIWDIRDLEQDVARLGDVPQHAVRLHNLLNGLGTIFEYAIFREGVDKEADVGERERRFLAFGLEGSPPREVRDVLDLGVRYGYLFHSIIARPSVRSTAELYHLSRRLAPLFNLDPSAVVAHRFFTSSELLRLMDMPSAAVALSDQDPWAGEAKSGGE